MKKTSTHSVTRHEQALNEHIEWEWQYGQVVAFNQSHGHTDLGISPVGVWLQRQKLLAEAGQLNAYRRTKLEAAGILQPAVVKKKPKEPAKAAL